MAPRLGCPHPHPVRLLVAAEESQAERGAKQRPAVVDVRAEVLTKGPKRLRRVALLRVEEEEAEAAAHRVVPRAKLARRLVVRPRVDLLDLGPVRRDGGRAVAVDPPGAHRLELPLERRGRVHHRPWRRGPRRRRRRAARRLRVAVGNAAARPVRQSAGVVVLGHLPGAESARARGSGARMRRLLTAANPPLPTRRGPSIVRADPRDARDSPLSRGGRAPLLP
eukprot:7390535-Prymnesium_polylepis.2